jgi:plasmid stabilization system protein ParE
MKVRLTLRAAQDLIEIADYIRAESPTGALSVRAAVLESLQLLSEAPRAGRIQSVEGVRKLVTRRYGYIIYYVVDDAAEEVAVLTIRHSARARPF